MKNKRLQLIFCLALPLAVGLAASWVSGGSELYDKLILPPLSPPGWVFPVMWTALYLLMGYASPGVDLRDGQVGSESCPGGLSCAAVF